jgi:hypothetical protein
MEIPFPAPDVRIAGRKYWRKRTRREWVASVAGQPMPAPQPDDEMLETSNQVRAALGNVSSMWIWRHSRSQSTGAAA